MWNRDQAPKSEPTPQQPTHSAPSSPSGPFQGEERRVVAWVGKSVVFRGDLISSEDMTIDGRIEGSIEVRNHHLTIGPNASIEADVAARQVTVFGKVAGSLTAQERVDSAILPQSAFRIPHFLRHSAFRIPNWYNVLFPRSPRSLQ